MTLSRLPAALALVCLAALPAQAQEQPAPAPMAVEQGVWSVTPFLSLTFGGDADSTSLGAGAAAAYSVTDVVAVEAEVSYAFDLAGDDNEIDWTLLGASANLLYHFPLENGMVPYATAGVGVSRASIDAGGDTVSSSEVGFNVGGGIKAPLNDSLAARGDIRYFKSSDAVPDVWRIYGGLTWTLRR